MNLKERRERRKIMEKLHDEKRELCLICYHFNMKSEDKPCEYICAWHGFEIKEDSRARDFNCEYYEEGE